MEVVAQKNTSLRREMVQSKSKPSMLRKMFRPRLVKIKDLLIYREEDRFTIG